MLYIDNSYQLAGDDEKVVYALSALTIGVYVFVGRKVLKNTVK